MSSSTNVEFALASRQKFLLSPRTFKELRSAYPRVDVEQVVKDAAKTSRNLRLVDGRAVLAFVRNELSKAQSEAAAKAAEAMARVAARNLSPAAPVSPEPVAPPPEPEVTQTRELPKPKAIKPHTGAPMIVELFKSMKSGSMQVMVQTSATSLDTYIPALAHAMSEAIHNEPENVDELLKGVLHHAVLVAIKVAGYKVESVKEQRVLTSGFVTPDEADRVGAADV